MADWMSMSKTKWVAPSGDNISDHAALAGVVKWLRREVNRLREEVAELRAKVESQNGAPAEIPSACNLCGGKGHYNGYRCACMPDMSCPFCKGIGWYLAFEGKASRRVACECNLR